MMRHSKNRQIKFKNEDQYFEYGKNKNFYSEMSRTKGIIEIIEDKIKALEQHVFHSSAKPDWASKAMRATIHSVHVDVEFKLKDRIQRIFQISYYSPENEPEFILQPTPPTAGECYAFPGHSARIIIKLAQPIIVEAVTIEHITKEMSPVGNVETALRGFSIFGLINPTDAVAHGYLFGSFEYFPSDGPFQTFAVENKSNSAYKFILIKVASNHGGRYTCVYR